MRLAPAIELTDEQEVELTRLARSKRTSLRLAQRAQIVLLAAQGLQSKDIAEQLGVGRVLRLGDLLLLDAAPSQIVRVQYAGAST